MAPGNTLAPRLMDRCQGTDIRRYGFDLPARAECVAAARRLTRDQLTRWGVDDDTCDTAALVVSELFTNALLHTASEHIVCELRDSDGRLRVAVKDQGLRPTGPQLRQAAEEEHGRGLQLVDAMSSFWGTRDAEDGPGRVVWAELPC
ncbi:ATP-binding protein [Streptomyces sp. ISL-98]|uniref:ATP-binding protein n=1 Tax=Streptomyces sp. ISL-98 TaxID=2819192 RepID=UPI001BE50ED2|nr:ATP-binding protein [Streptomyces sp. ISL-98]MBT2507882.1 ATP-binding protein [Streptomyces sp. ISL-98]